MHRSLTPSVFNMTALATGLAAALGLAGCGGSSSPATSVATPSALNLSGTAATGMALAGAKVDIKCSGGATSVTAGADGTYSASVTGAALPCMLRATSSDGTIVYHAALNSGTASASTAVANITPLTEIILALAVGDPTQVDATFTGNAALPAAVATNLSTAQTTLSTTLAAANINISGFDPVSTPLTAATSTSSSGDSQDQTLDSLMAKLATNRSSLTELSTTLSSGVSGSQAQQQATTLLGSTAAVPQCPSARPGTYWWINHNGGLTTIALDTTHGTVTRADVNEANGTAAEVDALTWGQGCQAQFTQQDGAVQKVTFASGGEFAAGNLATASLPGTMHVAVPMQKIPLAALVGNWNAIEYDSRVKTRGNAAATRLDTVTIDAQGNLTCASGCAGPLTISANDDGSLSVVSSDNTRTPLLVFRGADGHLTFLAPLDFPNKGGLLIGAPAAALSLPAVNATSTYVQYQLSGIPATGSTNNWRNFSIDTFTYEVTAVDSTNSSITRTYSTEDDATYDLVDTVEYNQPSIGFRTRPGLSFKDAAGTTFNKPTSYNLPLGTGMTVFADGAAGQYSSATPTSTAAPFFGLSVPLN